MIPFLFITFSLFTNGVVTDERESVSVMEGDSVTLHSDITEILRDDVIEWRFGHQQDLIAKINRAANKISFNVLDKRFTGRLKLNDNTGDLTITNIKTEHTGLYQLDIIREKTTRKTFSVSGVFDPESNNLKTMSVKNGDYVTLHIDVPDIKKYDVIQWRFQHENSPLAELNRNTAIFSIYDDVDDGRFKDKLQLDQTGSLTITNIRTEHSGLYEVNITSTSSSYTIHQSFTVTVNDSLHVWMETPLVMEGYSDTLHTDLGDIQKDYVIEWRFGPQETRIATINGEANEISIYDDVLDGRFKDRLQVNNQTGDLTITKIKTQHNGLYELKMSSRRRSIHRKFLVSVSSQSSDASIVLYVGVQLVAAAAAGCFGLFCYHQMFPKELLVMKGDPVILHNDYVVRQDDVEIEWRLGNQKTLIAKIMRKNGTTHKDVIDGRFGDRLTLRPHTGSLIINNTRTTDNGLYQLKIISSAKKSYKQFKLTVRDTHKLMMVKEKKPYTRHTDIELIPADENTYYLK